MMNVILPKTLCPVHRSFGPLFFLAGPVRGGGDWQSVAALLLRSHLERFYVAIPSRYTDDHPLMSARMSGNEGAFLRQLPWERHYLQMASKVGCIVFWLPEESKTDPRPKEDGPYGRDTLGELGRWSVWKAVDPHVRLVIGAEQGFSGLDVIRRNINEDMGYEFPIHSSLEATIKAAVSEAVR